MISIKKINNEVFFLKERNGFINQKHINFLKKKVNFTKRKRARICLHKNLKDRLHEMLIILSKDGYIRPHKHLNKVESLHVIEGSAEVIFFNNKGKIIKKKTIGSYGKGLDFFYRLDSSVYHTFNIKSKYFIFHESTEGPLIKSKTSYATWSPPEDNLIEAKNFIRSL